MIEARRVWRVIAVFDVLPGDSVDVVGRCVPLTIFQLNPVFDVGHGDTLSVGIPQTDSRTDSDLRVHLRSFQAISMS